MGGERRTKERESGERRVRDWKRKGGRWVPRDER